MAERIHEVCYLLLYFTEDSALDRLLAGLVEGSLFKALAFFKALVYDRVYQVLVPSTNYQVPTTKYRVPSTEYQVPSTEYRVPSTKYQVPSTKYQVVGTKYQAPSTKYQAPSTKY